jgi:hypothetical protein
MFPWSKVANLASGALLVVAVGLSCTQPTGGSLSQAAPSGPPSEPTPAPTGTPVPAPTGTPVPVALRVDYELRSWGRVARAGSVDDSSLSPEDAATLRSLVEDADFFGLPSQLRLDAGFTDRAAPAITVHNESGEHRVQVVYVMGPGYTASGEPTEADYPDAVWALFRWMHQRATPVP